MPPVILDRILPHDTVPDTDDVVAKYTMFDTYNAKVNSKGRLRVY